MDMNIRIIQQKPGSSVQTRYTRKEKEVLFSLFRQFQDTIDIRHRRNSSKRRNDGSVRQCWQKICSLYNMNPNIETLRNVKQLQKFWLNSRLRKQFPAPSSSKDENFTTKSEPELIISADTIETTEHVFKDGVYDEQITRDPNENDQTDCHNDNGIHIQNYVDVEHITTEKLSLNDLLQFKNDPLYTETLTQSTHHDTIVTQSGVLESRINKYTQTYPIICDNKASVDYQALPQSMMHQSESNLAHHGSNMTGILQDKLDHLRVKEAELKYQEELIRIERLKVDLEKSKEELRFMKEVNRIKIEEMKIKLDITCEEAKKNLNKCNNI